MGANARGQRFTKTSKNMRLKREIERERARATEGCRKAAHTTIYNSHTVLPAWYLTQLNRNASEFNTFRRISTAIRMEMNIRILISIIKSRNFVINVERKCPPNGFGSI